MKTGEKLNFRSFVIVPVNHKLPPSSYDRFIAAPVLTATIVVVVVVFSSVSSLFNQKLPVFTGSSSSSHKSISKLAAAVIIGQ